MIIMKMRGGLGNQLFQYALGRYLSIKNDTSLRLNILIYDYHTDRVFELKYFTIPKINTDISPLLSKPFKFIEDQYFHFNIDVMSAGKYSYLDGFWQCENYFNQIRPILLNELQIKRKYVTRLEVKANEITSEESVAVHIRRGDYMDSQYIDSFGVLPVDYYKKAINFIKQAHANAKFYFFSDDSEWVKRNLTSGDDSVVSNTVTHSGVEDFYLMSKCKHHIIANSTFSWWAAWLCQNDNKIVIGPKRWFSSSIPNTKDVLPKEWISL